MGKIRLRCLHEGQLGSANAVKLKPCLHVTSAFAFVSNIKYGFYGNK